MSRGKSASLPLFCRGDVNAFWALFADNLANMIIVAVVLTRFYGISGDVVYGHVLPGLGMALIAGLGFYAWQARKLARETGRDDVTALPYGISTPIMFVYLFGIIGGVYRESGDGLLAWQVGLAAAFIGGCFEALGSLVGPWLKTHLPRAGMLGTLAGISLVFIAAVPLAEVFELPLVGFPALGIILVGLVAARKLPFGLPAGLVAIVVGTTIALFTGDSHWNTEGVAIYYPLPMVSDLIAGIRALGDHSWVLAIVLPAEVYNFIETMNNVESAEAAGDKYPVRTCQVVDGTGTMIGALFGAPFPTTVYIGHPGYKRLGARSGYALAVGVVFFVGSLFGLVALLADLIPVAAVAPILVFIGLVITAQAFTATPKAHAMAVAIAMLPHVSNLLMIKWGGLMASVGTVLGDVEIPSLLAPAMLEEMARNGAHVAGHASLAGGAIVVGMLWGSLTAFLIDGKLGRATITATAGAVLTLLGMIHATSLGINRGPVLQGYVVIAAILGILWLLSPKTSDEDERPTKADRPSKNFKPRKAKRKR